MGPVLPQIEGPLKPAEILESPNWPAWACGKFVAKSMCPGSSELALHGSPKGEGGQERTRIRIQIFVNLYWSPVTGLWRIYPMGLYIMRGGLPDRARPSCDG